MSDFFNYTFDIVNPDALSENGASGTSSYPAVASAAPSVLYAPSSYFYTDVTKIADAVSANLTTDAFGPVSGSETTKYRVTSFIRSNTSDLVKVFAISDGQIFIQPQDGDPTRVNLIIKNSSNSYSPLKIKYFIYRGVNKADLIDGVNLKALNTSNPADPNEPELLKRLWKTFLELNPGVTSFPANFIGYDPNQSPETNIEELFCRNIDVLVSKGEHIGNFKDILGLDIVLDYGDYELEHQEVLFKLNLGYARKKEQVFDVSTVSGAVKQKRYKEYIHQFIDAAAFWGSHIKKGKIYISPSIFYNSINDVYNKFLNKYQTKNRVYIYIIEDCNRTFGYYNNDKLVSGFEDEPNRNNNTYGWPILFNKRNLPVSSLPADEVENEGDFVMSGIKLEIECSVGNNIEGSDSNGNFLNSIIERDQYLSIYNLDYSRKKDLKSYSLENFDRNSVTNKMTYDYYVKYYILENNVCSCFLFISTNLEQQFPLEKYYNKLWIPNINSCLKETSFQNKNYTVSFDRSLNVNLKEVIKEGAVVKQSIIFDKGRKPNDTSITKRRRLYITHIKRNFNEKNIQYSNLNIDKNFSSFVDNISTLNDYINFIYRDSDCTIYKGKFNDNGNEVYSLSLNNKSDYWLKNSFYHLGITEDDYSKLLFVEGVQQISFFSDNMNFILEEINVINDSFRKFILGIKYENELGNIVTYFPSSPINIYTVDGLFFFSKDYSDYQEFYEEFSNNAIINFRPHSDWDGEFGFDWVRIGDSGLKGDTLSAVNIPDRRYMLRFGNYYKTPTSFEKLEYKLGSSSPSVFRSEKSEYLSFANFNYNIYPSVNGLYFSSWLNLYPERDELNALLNYPKINNGNKSCYTTAKINLKIKILNNISRLRIQFEKAFINITPENVSEFGTMYSDEKFSYLDLRDLSISNSKNIIINIKSLKETINNSKIRILVTENGIEKLAGETILHPNHKSFRKKVNIAFINYKTNINGTDKKFDFLSLENLQFLKILYKIDRTLNQSLIEIGDTKIIDFDLRPSIGQYREFNTDWTKSFGSESVIDYGKRINNLYLSTFLSNKVRAILGRVILPNDYFLVNSINEYADLNGLPTYGSAEVVIPSKSLTLFEKGYYDDDPNTPSFVFSHELYHALGLLDHTFSYNYKNLFISEFSFTDNFMDYPHLNTNKISSTSLWKYQRDFAIKSKNPLLKPI